MRLIYTILCFMAAFLGVPQAQAQLTFALTTGDNATGIQSLAADSNKCPTEGPIAAYVGGIVTNSGTTLISGIEAEITGLTSGFSLTGTQSSIYTVGSLAAGDTAMVAWHITYPCDNSNKTTPGPTIYPSITVMDDSGGSMIRNLTLRSRKAISANAGGNVLSTVLGAGAIVGQTITADVIYDFGGNSVGDEFFTQPAGNTDFDAACLKLVGTEVLSSNIDAAPAGTIDQLYFVSPTTQSGNNYFIETRFFYKYICANTVTTARPYAVQTSGSTNIKYTGNYDGGGNIVFNFPTSTNPFTIAKTASEFILTSGSGPQNVTYTVTLNNPSTFDAIIDSFTDILPGNSSFVAIAPGSDITAANSGGLPSAGDMSTVTFEGLSGSSFAIPANSSLTLIYTVAIPDVDGEYINTASANVSTTSVGTAQSTVIMGGAQLDADKSVSVYDPDAMGLYATPGNDIVYTFTVTNSGSGEASDGTVILEDILPPDIEFYNGDFDPLNVGMGPFDVSPGTSGVTCCASGTEVDFTNSSSAPYTYGYNPATGYDSAVTGIRFSPSNAFQGNSTLTISFRARIP